MKKRKIRDIQIKKMERIKNIYKKEETKKLKENQTKKVCEEKKRKEKRN